MTFSCQMFHMHVFSVEATMPAPQYFPDQRPVSLQSCKNLDLQSMFEEKVDKGTWTVRAE
jgi:hypothetical protein